MSIKIEVVKIKDLKHAEYNPRRLTKKQFQDIKSSLTEFGFVAPIIVNHHPDRINVIVGGHQRVRVWDDMGHDSVPVIFVSLPLKKEKELNVRLNRNVGEWDWDILANEFDDEDLVQWGFEPDEFFGADEDRGDDKGDDNDFKKISFTLHKDQYELVTRKIEEFKDSNDFQFVETFENEDDDGNVLYGVFCNHRQSTEHGQ